MKIECKNISVSINGKQIISDINLKFAEGKITAIIGANGVGKSTLLKILAALNSNYDGEVLLNEKNIRNLSRKKIARHLAILPQTMQIPPDITVARLIDYGRFPYRSLFSRGNPKEDEDAVNWAISVVNLEKFKDRQVNSLSGGERQRARIAMALAQVPQIMLFDEPTTYLDIAHQLEVMQIIRLINEKYKMSVIMVVHDINHALQFSDEVIVLKDGKIFAQGQPQQILNVDLLEKVFGVKADIFTNSLGASVISPVATIQRKFF